MAKLKLDEVHQRIKDMSEDGIEIILEDNNYQGIKKEYSFYVKNVKPLFLVILGISLQVKLDVLSVNLNILFKD